MINTIVTKTEEVQVVGNNLIGQTTPHVHAILVNDSRVAVSLRRNGLLVLNIFHFRPL